MIPSFRWFGAADPIPLAAARLTVAPVTVPAVRVIAPDVSGKASPVLALIETSPDAAFTLPPSATPSAPSRVSSLPATPAPGFQRTFVLQATEVPAYVKVVVYEYGTDRLGSRSIKLQGQKHP
jgi:hypothetical protein